MAVPDRIVAGGFSVAARLRRTRVFHPSGVALTGGLHALDDGYARLLGGSEHPVLARLSKGAGLPGGLPDVLGLTLRVLDRRSRPWDLVLASTGSGMVGRLLVVPARGWAQARYGSVMAYRFGGGTAYWLIAEPDAGQPDTAAIGDLRAHLRRHRLHFTVRAEPCFGPARTLAEVVLSAPEIGAHAAPGFFDPVLNRPAEVTLLPRTLASVRASAYQGSRRGRNESDEIADAGIAAFQGSSVR